MEQAPLLRGGSHPRRAAPPLSCPGRAPRSCIRAGGWRRTWSAARGLGYAAPAGEVHALPIPRPRTWAGLGKLRSRARLAHPPDARAARPSLNPDQPPSPRKVGTKHYSPCSANLHGGSRGSAETRALQSPAFWVPRNHPPPASPPPLPGTWAAASAGHSPDD